MGELPCLTEKNSHLKHKYDYYEMTEENNKPKILYSLVDPSTDNDTQLTLAKYQLIYSIVGLCLGLTSIIGGIYLFIKGISGSMSWSANIFGANSNIINAAPGAVLFIVGLFIVLITRYKFKHIKRN